MWKGVENLGVAAVGQIGAQIGQAALMGENVAQSAAKGVIQIAVQTLSALLPVWTASALGYSLTTPESILSGGVTGFIEWAALTAVLEAAVSAAGAAAMGMVDGWKRGGYTGDGDPNEVAGAVHRGEYVVNAGAVSRGYLPLLEAINSSGSSRGGTEFAKALLLGANVNTAMDQFGLVGKDKPGIGMGKGMFALGASYYGPGGTIQGELPGLIGKDKAGIGMGKGMFGIGSERGGTEFAKIGMIGRYMGPTPVKGRGYAQDRPAAGNGMDGYGQSGAMTHRVDVRGEMTSRVSGSDIHMATTRFRRSRLSGGH